MEISRYNYIKKIYNFPSSVIRWDLIDDAWMARFIHQLGSANKILGAKGFHALHQIWRYGQSSIHNKKK